MQSFCSGNRKRLWMLLALILAACTARGGVMVWRFEHLQQDPDAYRLLAENLANHGVFGNVDEHGNRTPTAFRPPGYPWLLSWFVIDGELTSLSVAGLHLMVGIATVIVVFSIGCRLLSDYYGFIAGLLVAIDPILLVQATLVMTETCATLIAAAAWWMIVQCDPTALPMRSTRSRIGCSIGLGIALSGGFFCRPVFIVWAMLICLMLIVVAKWQTRRALLSVVPIGLIMMSAIGCWTWRNAKVMGKPIWATTHGGYTLLLGNNPSFYQYLAEGRFGEKWDAEFFHQRWAQRRFGDPTLRSFWNEQQIDNATPARRLTEIEDDRLAQTTAKATIKRQPAIFVYSCFIRLARLWSPMPHAGDYSTSLRLAIGSYYVLMFGSCAIGMWRLGRRLLATPWLAMLLLAIALSGVHSIYWSNMRMRALATPLLAVLAAAGYCSRSQHGSRDSRIT